MCIFTISESLVPGAAKVLPQGEARIRRQVKIRDERYVCVCLDVVANVTCPNTNPSCINLHIKFAEQVLLRLDS